MTVILVILLSWVALMALMLGMFHISSGTPTPRPAPHRFRTRRAIELSAERRQVA